MGARLLLALREDSWTTSKDDESPYCRNTGKDDAMLQDIHLDKQCMTSILYSSAFDMHREGVSELLSDHFANGNLELPRMFCKNAVLEAVYMKQNAIKAPPSE